MLVSVIIPTYNCADYIGETLDSILAQTLTDWEVVVMDDCSTDATEDVVKSYAEYCPRIHYYRLGEHMGPAAARNEGIKRASGRYIAFLDSDDIWKPEKLEKQIRFMEEMKAKFSCTAYMRMDANGKLRKYMWIPPEKTDYRRCLLLSNPIGNLTAMYDREAVGQFKIPDIGKRNDFALWLQILRRVDYCYGMQEVLAVYRTGRYSSVSYHRFGLIKYHWRLYREIEGHGILRSLFEMGCWLLVKGFGIGSGKRRVR